MKRYEAPNPTYKALSMYINVIILHTCITDHCTKIPKHQNNSDHKISPIQ